MKKIIIISVLVLSYLNSTAAVLSENFDTFTGSGYNTHVYNGWTISDGLSESTKSRSGKAVRLDKSPSSGQYLLSPMKTGGIGTVSFWYRHWDGDTHLLGIEVEISVNGTSWTSIGTISGFNSTTYTNFTAVVNNATAKYLRITHTSGSERLILDDVNITDNVSGGCTGFYRDTVSNSICAFDSINFRGTYYIGAGFYSDTVISTCDTIFTLNLSTTTSIIYPFNDTICANNDSVLFNGMYLKISGTYYDTILRAGNCDSISQLNLITNYCPTPCSELFISEYIEGGSNNKALEFYNPTASTIDLTPYYIIIYRSSTDTIQLSGNVLPYDVHVISHPSASLLGITSNSDATATIYFNGDDVIELVKGNVVIDIFGSHSVSGNFAKDRTYQRKSIIQNSSIIYNSSDWNILPKDTDSLIGSHTNSCLVCNITPDTTTTNICIGDSATNGVTYYNTTGIYSDTLVGLYGCDSIRVLNLTVNSISHDTIQNTICEGNSIVFKGLTLTVSGTYVDSNTNVNGCDSVTTLNLTVKSVYRDTLVQNICVGDSLLFGGTYYSTTGIFSDTNTGSNGCDSINVLDLTTSIIIMPATNHVACNNFVLPSGRVITGSGTYVEVLTASAGCDSIVTSIVTINYTRHSHVNITVCASYTAPSGAIRHTSGIFQDTITTVGGCDSIITINLNVHPATTVKRTISSCFSYTVPETGVTYNASGTYTDVTTNAYGCAHTITTILTIGNINAGTVSITGATLSVTTTGVSYKWIDCDNESSHMLGGNGQSYTPVRNGNFACVVISNDGCKDTTACTSVNSASLDEYVINENDISIFPNPASDIVTIDILNQNTKEDVTIQLFDAIGKLVFTTTVNSTNNTIKVDVTKFEKGAYSISVFNEFFKTTKKLIVVK